MYTLTHREENGWHFMDLSHPQNNSKATFCLNQGGRLSALEIDGVQVLADFDPSSYKTNYASAILFPFANRIKNGTYTFEGTTYVLHCNESDKNNALHGLVYDKTFRLIDQNLSNDHGMAILQYTHDAASKGFPFKFQIQLIYKLTSKNFSVSVEVLNQDTKAFPFVLGWHPYFRSENLGKSALNFECSTQFLHDGQQILSGRIPSGIDRPFVLKNVKLDHGYALDSNTVVFTTPEYRMTMSSSSKENYLQLYTPQESNVIAIEPMTGANNSFNNEIGLQILAPRKQYQVLWNLAFVNNSTNPLIT